TSVHNLAFNLRDRFQQRGVPSDLDESIEPKRAALLRPPGHSLRSMSLDNKFAISLQGRFKQRGVPSDL
ncbi:hypothetical protein EDB19DRAFT_1586056, partial [Suillus lakei]